ncbi:CusA/CzcA family heavy metal efflux RND transporter [Dokdonella soli]|uniref:CusA/CzcA family heavy metal efflux RND transporter n=1 Tax=Dokdonella soli TaxID=529810 RepID=A0ABN1IBQ6_9GAMM
MIERLVALCLRQRIVVWMVFVFVALYGAVSFLQLPIEAYPDIADTTSQVVTQVPGLAAEEVERQITIPLERGLINTPGIEVLRSKSTFALSLITVVFKDGVEDYWSRQRLQERLQNITLPYGAQPGLDALTSPIGEIYRYTLESKTHSLRELSELQLWTVIPRLKAVPGVVDVANFGGLTTTYQLTLDPQRLVKYNLSLAQVEAAVKANNSNAGGSVITRGEQGFVVRGIGLIGGLDDLGNVVVLTTKDGTPVRIRDLGAVTLGNVERHGILGYDHQSDHIEGITLLLKNEPAAEVIPRVHQAVEELNSKLLPPDVKVVPYIDRSMLIGATVHTVSHTLTEGLVLVTLILLLFLGSPRAAIIVALTVPLSLLIAFVFMHHAHIPANLLSLGAIDFGILVDGAIVVLENVLRQREANEGRPLTLRDVYMASIQVGRPVFFATLIIITAYIPLFSFQRVEYKLFSPMAWAVGFSLVGALMVALTLIPGLAYVAYRKPRAVFHNRVIELANTRYQALLGKFASRSRLALGICAASLVVVLGLLLTIGRDFLPYLDEGSLWLQVTLPQGISLNKASEYATDLRNATLEFPEVEHIVTQLGRNDDGTDPFTPSHIECAVTLHPYDTWKSGMTKQELIEKLAARYKRLPGVDVQFNQPMIDGVYDKLAGAHSELVIKVHGEDFAELRRIAVGIMQTLATVSGAVDVAMDQEPPLPQVRITLDREAAARYGLNADDVSDLISSGISGGAQSQLYVGERVYPITVKLAGFTRDDPDKLGDLLLTTPSGAHVPLAQVAKIEIRSGESTITREMGHRHVTVKLNLRGRDLGSFLAEAQPKIDAAVKYDHVKYQVSWGGQFENQQRAQQRLMLIVPIVVALMFVLLYAAFRTARHAILILLTLPLATLGGLLALHLRGMTLNVSSAVGFIALSGVAVQNGIIMVSNLNRWRDSGSDLLDAVIHGAAERFRPVLMTASVAMLGLLPAALAHGLGSDVQRPLATVVVGGLITATVLTLLVLPTLYYLIETRVAERIRTSTRQLDQTLDTDLSGDAT